MKLSSILCCSALLMLGLFSACGNDSEATQNTPADNTAVPGALGTEATPGAPLPEPAQNAQGLWHYTCPKGCAGGAGTATACATCGETLVHSQTYHGTTQQAPAPESMATPMGGANTTQMTPPAPPTTKPEPPQNAAGVWHYTCASGCSGGAGAATPCATCGKALVHNTSYHK